MGTSVVPAQRSKVGASSASLSNKDYCCSMSLGPPSSRQPRLHLRLQEDCSCLEDAAGLLFDIKAPSTTRSLNPRQILEIYHSLRLEGVSLNQVHAAIAKVCSEPPNCQREEFKDLLQELDRRYFILKSAKWEFSLLDRQNMQTISEQDVLFFFRAVHRSCFTFQSWQGFLNGRSYPATRVTWEEIEVPLCDIPEWAEAQVVREAEAMRVDEIRRRHEQQLAEERRREEEEARKREAVARERERVEMEARATEERLSRERAEREQEERSRKEDEDAKRRHLDEEVTMATEREREAQRLAREAGERAKMADTEAAKIAAEESRKQALIQAKQERHTRLKAELTKAIKTEEMAKIEPAVEAVKREKIDNCHELIAEAEQMLGKLRASKNLRSAMVARKLAALEKAVDNVKRGGFEQDLQREMAKGRALLEKLRRLEQMKKAVLSLSQSVVAEIKSYSKPPPVVHTVMTATFLLLGNSENETKSWPATQILIGKTGKESLKRRVAECTVEMIPKPMAKRALNLLKSFDFTIVEDASVGCAVFYAWAEGMIDEVLQGH